MLYFVRKALLFALPLIIMAMVFECVARLAPNEYKIKENLLKNHASEAELLIIGASHALYGIRPDMIDVKSYNLANVSETYDYSYFMLLHHANDYKKLKYVITTVGYYTFPYEKLETEAPFLCTAYRLYNDCYYHRNNPLYNFEIIYPEQCNQRIKAFFCGSESLKCDSLGWGNNYQLSRRPQNFCDIKNTMKWVKKHTAFNYENERYNYDCLCKIAKFCKDRKIKFILVSTPVWHTYAEKCNKDQMERMEHYINKVCKEYGATYRDYHNDPRFEDEDFFDVCHLTDNGAEKFTKILVNDLKLYN